MHASPDPRLVMLFQKAQIIQAFPAYTLESLNNAPVRDLLQAMELVGLAKKVLS